MTSLMERISEEELNKASNILKVIAHPVRMCIVDLLRDNNRLSVVELQGLLNLEQPIASQHLTLMQDKGILRSERVGKNRFYSLAKTDLTRVVDCIEHCLQGSSK